MRKKIWIVLVVLVLPISQSAWARSYTEVVQFMKNLESRNPGTTQLFALGLSDSGQMIQGVKIGNGPVKNLVVGTHHGNEYGSTEVAKAVAQDLSERSLADQTVYVIPVLNIGGYNAGVRAEMAGGRNYDPNRDYPGPCGTAGPFHLKSTRALADFIASEQIVTVATLHTYSPAVLYPWGISTRDTGTPYDDIFIHLGQLATVESHYDVGNSTLLLYPADGTFEDYTFWEHGIWGMLFELGFTHYPSQGQIDEMVRVNVPGIRRMLANAPRERAADHAFHGRCDSSLKNRDRHDE